MAQRCWNAKILALVSISCGIFATVIIFGNRNPPIIGNESHIHLPICTKLDESVVDFNKLVNWANNIEILQKTDESRHKLLWEEIQPSEDLNQIRDGLYRYVNHPMQGVCKVGKYFGGIWLSGYGCLDGHKYVCLDTLYEDVLKNECLIYSFGINNEWSFEENMISMGCTIRSFDPTIDGLSKPKTDLVTFQKIGLADQARVDGVNQFVTLSGAIDRMGDSGRRISYLKVDIEGAELSALKDWIASGVLEYVSQIGIEIHSTHSRESGNGTLFGLLETFRSLDKAGFKLINISNNECVGKNFDLNHQFYTIFELVFYKH